MQILKIFTIFLMSLLFWGAAEAKEIIAYPTEDGTATETTTNDTLIGNSADTSDGFINEWLIDSKAKPGLPTYGFYMTVLSGAPIDCVFADYYVSQSYQSGSADKDSDVWLFVKRLWLDDFSLDNDIDTNENILVPPDSLPKGSWHIGRWVYGMLGAGATDSIKIRPMYSADKGTKLVE